MAQARAFVGHSFTTDDEALVAVFLEYFEQIAELHPPFSWTHAKTAEPTELAKKVIGLVKDCNVFIAICTIKEHAANSRDFKAGLWDSSRRRIENSALEAKTSDWIIQELGLAVGREMQIVILLENGCRRPGGLQGDVEFISFERAAPEKSFGKLLEMIRALSPTPPRGEGQTQTLPAIEPEDAAGTADADEPTNEWDLLQFEHSFFVATLIQDVEKAQRITDAFLNRLGDDDTEQRTEWEAFTELQSILWGKDGHIDKLIESSTKFPNNKNISSYLAQGYAKFGNHRKSAETYLESAAALEVVETSSNLRGLAAEQFAKDGNTKDAFIILDDLRKNVNLNEYKENEFLHHLLNVAEIIDDLDLQTNTLERILSIVPDDIDNRFSLAFKYSELKFNDLSLYHYLQIPFQKRNSAAWNNLGVAYQNHSAQGMSVDAYNRSAEAGESLAMSNLAYKYLNAGFFIEAKEKIDQALSCYEPHRNVGETFTTLKDRPDQEKKSIDEIVKSSKEKRNFLQDLGKALATHYLGDIDGEWLSPDCCITIHVDGYQFHAHGEYEADQNAWASALLGAGGTATKSKYRILYTGFVVGSRIFGTVERISVGSKVTSSLLGVGSSDRKIKFAMIIDSSRATIRVMENLESSSPKYYEMEKHIAG